MVGNGGQKEWAPAIPGQSVSNLSDGLPAPRRHSQAVPAFDLDLVALYGRVWHRTALFWVLGEVEALESTRPGVARRV